MEHQSTQVVGGGGGQGMGIMFLGGMKVARGGQGPGATAPGERERLLGWSSADTRATLVCPFCSNISLLVSFFYFFPPLNITLHISVAFRLFTTAASQLPSTDCFAGVEVEESLARPHEDGQVGHAAESVEEGGGEASPRCPPPSPLYSSRWQTH